MPIDSETAIRLPPWRALLRGARQREGRSPGATWLQLATTAEDGTPRVRTLVFRGWSSRGELELLTDVRSDKPAADPKLKSRNARQLHRTKHRQQQKQLCWFLRCCVLGHKSQNAVCGIHV